MRSSVLVVWLATAVVGSGVAARQGGEPQGREGPGAAERPTGVLTSVDGAQAGYTLVAPLRSTTTYLVGLDGEVVHRWESDSPPGQSVRLLADGRLMRCERVEGNPTFRGGGEGGRVKLIEPDGRVAWSFEYSSEEHLQHHDATVLPDGNVLLVAWERLSREEALAAGRDPELVSDQGLWLDHLVEVKPSGETTGEIVWEWHSKDHLVQDRDRSRPGYGAIAEHPGRIDVNADAERVEPTDAALEEELRKLRELGYLGTGDDEEDDEPDPARDRRRMRADYLHVNSVDYDPLRDLVVLSVRELSEVWVIDHSTTTEEAAGSRGGRYGRGGDLLFRFGNPRMHGAGTEADRQLYFQHDAQVIPAGRPGAGNLLVFNNGSREDGRAWSSVDEVALPLDDEGRLRVPTDGGIAPAEIVWTYVPTDGEQPVFSSHISGCERLPNGSTLVCCGEQGRVLEVSSDGEIVWDWRNPFEDQDLGPGRGGPGEGPFGRAGRRPGRPDRMPPEGEDAPSPPRGRRGFPPPPGMRGPGGRGGPGGAMAAGIFRARRYPPDHPGIERVLASAGAAEASSGRPGEEGGEER
jgi:hypothetical protein